MRYKALLTNISVCLKRKDGMGTVELVLIIAVLIGLALLFKDTIVGFVKSILGDISAQQKNFSIKSIVD